jgi:hypothetical protein
MIVADASDASAQPKVAESIRQAFGKLDKHRNIFSGYAAGLWLVARPQQMSGNGTFAKRSPSQGQLRNGGRCVGRSSKRSHIGSGWYDLVDPVENFVGERDFGALQQVVELLNRAGTDNRGCYGWMCNHKRHSRLC